MEADAGTEKDREREAERGVEDQRRVEHAAQREGEGEVKGTREEGADELLSCLDLCVGKEFLPPPPCLDPPTCPHTASSMM